MLRLLVCAWTLPKKNLFTIHVAPQFLQFIFEKNENRKITLINRSEVQTASATACVRIEFKTFKRGFPFDFGAGGDPTNGSVAKSQKDKVDSMIMWDSNPLFIKTLSQSKVTTQ